MPARAASCIPGPHLGTILAAAGLSFQRTRTWKASPDPDYERKAARVISLCKRPPANSAVVSFDQMGPVSPPPGSATRRLLARRRSAA